MAIAVFMGMCCERSNAQVTTEVEWQRCIGGSAAEFGSIIKGTSDGGFICVGYTTSTDGDAIGSHGGTDLLATKLNADGTVQWTRMLGGSSEELGFGCMEASDGAIMIIGFTYSTDGDVTNNHGDSDLWVLKLSPLGAIVWQRTYGGSGSESGGQIQQTPDGGFVIQAPTSSDDGDVTGFHPGGATSDTWVLKITSTGAIEWTRTLGGSGNDSGGRMIQTADGGYLLSFSITESSDGDVTSYHGDGDCWLVKLSAAGAIEWQRTVGGSQRDFGSDIKELSNGDLLLLATTLSNDGDIALNNGGYDVLLAKISGSGTLLWEQTYGGTMNDDVRSLLPTGDGGFLLSGGSNSSDGDVTTNNGDQDVWVLKVDANGSILWQRSYGGSLNDWAFAWEPVNEGFLLTGITYSNNGDVQGGHGDRELWFVKLNENGDLLWQRSLGGSAEDWGYVQVQTTDGGYVAFGYTDSNDGDVSGNHGGRDMWAVKLKVTEPTEPLECALYIPNAFSPNNSTKNDSHCIYGTDCVTSMTFNIFDRWGNKVFESTDPNTCWDGTFSGQALDPAVFVFHLTATMINGETVERQGNVTLVR